MASDDDREFREEIEAEIADHLASVADELKREGAAAEEAQEQAAKRFGDVRRIVRRCLWAQRGDEIMLRIVGVGLVALLTVAVIVVAFGSWRAQESLGERLAQLGDHLAKLSESQENLAETQRDLAARPSQQPAPRITGRMLFRDGPPEAVMFDGWIWQRDQRNRGYTQIRQIAVNADGTFDSGPLPPGEYVVIASVDTPEETQKLLPYGRWHMQSQPFYLYYPGVELPHVEFDLRPKGTLHVTLDEKLPDQIDVDGLQVKIAVRPVLIPRRPPTSLYPIDAYAMDVALRPDVRKWPVKYMTFNSLQGAPALGVPSELLRDGWRLTVPGTEYRFAVLVHGYLKQPSVELFESLSLVRIPPKYPPGGGGQQVEPWGWAMPFEPLEAFMMPRSDAFAGLVARKKSLLEAWADVPMFDFQIPNDLSDDQLRLESLRVRIPQEFLDLIASNPGRDKLAELLTPRIATLEVGDAELSQKR